MQFIIVPLARCSHIFNRVILSSSIDHDAATFTVYRSIFEAIFLFSMWVIVNIFIFEFGNAHTFNVHVGLRVWISNEPLRWLKGLFHCSMGARFPFFVCVGEIRDVIAAATRKSKTQNYTRRHYWHANNPAIIAKSSPLASKAERHSRSSLIYCAELNTLNLW